MSKNRISFSSYVTKGAVAAAVSAVLIVGVQAARAGEDGDSIVNRVSDPAFAIVKQSAPHSDISALVNRVSDPALAIVPEPARHIDISALVNRVSDPALAIVEQDAPKAALSLSESKKAS